MGDLFMKSAAIISECGRYRYALTRQWGMGPTALFIMLNPSTADAEVDDPTIRRCINFAKREGCGGLRVENLYAMRATNPDDMFSHGHFAFGDTHRFIREAASTVMGPVIAAWGADVRAERRARGVVRILEDVGRPVFCLGMTKSGAPRHPLYVRADAPLLSYLPHGRAICMEGGM